MLCPTPAPRLSISQRLNRFVYTFPHHTPTTINIMITLYARFHPKPARFKANQCLRISTHRRSNASEFAAPSKDSHWRGRSQVAGARRNTWAEDAPELVRPLCLRDPTILDAESRCRTPNRASFFTLLAPAAGLSEWNVRPAKKETLPPPPF